MTAPFLFFNFDRVYGEGDAVLRCSAERAFLIFESAVSARENFPYEMTPRSVF